jgi:hypothetical protein
MIFQIFGTIQSPYKGRYLSGVNDPSGSIFFLNNVLKLVFTVGGILVLLNLIIAGFQFINAQGDSKAIENAWNKIWQSMVGLLIVICSFLVAGLAGMILFGDATAILKPKIYGP